jgi:hypothetical protein
MHKLVVLINGIKNYIKTPPTCFDVVTPSSGSALFVLATAEQCNIHTLTKIY